MAIKRKKACLVSVYDQNKIAYIFGVSWPQICPEIFHFLWPKIKLRKKGWLQKSYASTGSQQESKTFFGVSEIFHPILAA